MGENANQLLQTESLQTTSLEIRHSRLIDSKSRGRYVLVPTPNQRNYLSAQLLFEIGNRVFRFNHSKRCGGARCSRVRNL